MKFTSMIVGALAAVASAAPVKEEKRSFGIGGVSLGGVLNGFDVNAFNGFQFLNSDIAYLWGANAIGFDAIQLASFQGLNVLPLADLFFAQQFDLNAMILLAQAKAFSTINQFGLLQSFDLSPLSLFGVQNQLFGGFNLGLAFDQLAFVGLDGFLDAQLALNLQNVAFNEFNLLAGGVGINGLGGVGVFKE